MKRSLIVGVLIVIMLAVLWCWMQRASMPASVIATDQKNTSYVIAGQTVALVNGRSEMSVAPDSASKIVTQYFGNEATGDLNNDGIPDIAFLVTQTTGGSGTFYYVVVALKNGEG